MSKRYISLTIGFALLAAGFLLKSAVPVLALVLLVAGIIACCYSLWLQFGGSGSRSDVDG